MNLPKLKFSLLFFLLSISYLSGQSSLELLETEIQTVNDSLQQFELLYSKEHPKYKKQALFLADLYFNRYEISKKNTDLYNGLELYKAYSLSFQPEAVFKELQTLKSKARSLKFSEYKKFRVRFYDVQARISQQIRNSLENNDQLKGLDINPKKSSVRQLIRFLPKEDPLLSLIQKHTDYYIMFGKFCFEFHKILKKEELIITSIGAYHSAYFYKTAREEYDLQAEAKRLASRYHSAKSIFLEAIEYEIKLYYSLLGFNEELKSRRYHTVKTEPTTAYALAHFKTKSCLKQIKRSPETLFISRLYENSEVSTLFSFYQKDTENIYPIIKSLNKNAPEQLKILYPQGYPSDIGLLLSQFAFEKIAGLEFDNNPNKRNPSIKLPSWKDISQHPQKEDFIRLAKDFAQKLSANVRYDKYPYEIKAFDGNTWMIYPILVQIQTYYKNLHKKGKKSKEYQELYQLMPLAYKEYYSIEQELIDLKEKTLPLPQLQHADLLEQYLKCLGWSYNGPTYWGQKLKVPFIRISKIEAFEMVFNSLLKTEPNTTVEKQLDKSIKLANRHLEKVASYTFYQDAIKQFPHLFSENFKILNKYQKELLDNETNYIEDLSIEALDSLITTYNTLHNSVHKDYGYRHKYFPFLSKKSLWDSVSLEIAIFLSELKTDKKEIELKIIKHTWAINTVCLSFEGSDYNLKSSYYLDPDFFNMPTEQDSIEWAKRTPKHYRYVVNIWEEHLIKQRQEKKQASVEKKLESALATTQIILKIISQLDSIQQQQGKNSKAYIDLLWSNAVRIAYYLKQAKNTAHPKILAYLNKYILNYLPKGLIYSSYFESNQDQAILLVALLHAQELEQRTGEKYISLLFQEEEEKLKKADEQILKLQKENYKWISTIEKDLSNARKRKKKLKIELENIRLIHSNDPLEQFLFALTIYPDTDLNNSIAELGDPDDPFSDYYLYTDLLESYLDTENSLIEYLKNCYFNLDSEQLPLLKDRLEKWLLMAFSKGYFHTFRDLFLEDHPFSAEQLLPIFEKLTLELDTTSNRYADALYLLTDLYSMIPEKKFQAKPLYFKLLKLYKKQSTSSYSKLLDQLVLEGSSIWDKEEKKVLFEEYKEVLFASSYFGRPDYSLLTKLTKRQMNVGNLVNAENLMNAISEYFIEYDNGEGIGGGADYFVDLTTIYLELGLTEKAIDIGTSSFASVENNWNNYDWNNCYLYSFGMNSINPVPLQLRDLYILNDLELYEISLKKAKTYFEIFKKDYARPVDYAKLYQLLGQSAFQLEEFGLAKKYFTKSAEYTETLEADQNCLALDWANYYNQLGEYKLAIQSYNKVFDCSNNNLQQIKAAYQLAKLHQLDADSKAAESTYIKMMELLFDRLERNYALLNIEEQHLFFKTLTPYIDAFYSFAVEYPTKNISSLLLNTHLLVKGLGLEQSTNLQSIVNNSKNLKLKKIYANLQNVRKEIAEASTKANEEQIDIRSLYLQTYALENQLSQESEALRSYFKQENRQISFKDIQSYLKPSELAIDYIIVPKTNREGIKENYYYAILMTKEQDAPQLIELCSAEDLNFSLEMGVQPNSINYISDALESYYVYQLTFEPLEPYLKGYTTINLCPTAGLSKIAFGTLISSDHSNQRLMDKYAIHYYTSLRNMERVENNTQKEKKVMLVGGVEFTLDKAQLAEIASNKEIELNPENLAKPDLKDRHAGLLAMAKSRGEDFSPLPGTLKEVNNIQNLFAKNEWETTKLTGLEALEENLVEQAAKKAPAILHIATHGFFFTKEAPQTEDDQQKQRTDKSVEKRIASINDPLLRSGLALTGVNQVWKGGQAIEGLEDGIFTALEVSNMDLSKTELVVLSACETARGDIDANEGVMGLQRAFKMAGAQRLIISLWKVPDAQTAELMQLFYQNYLSGQEVHASFKNAQAEMRKRYRNPYYWAAFILIE